MTSIKMNWHSLLIADMSSHCDQGVLLNRFVSMKMLACIVLASFMFACSLGSSASGKKGQTSKNLAASYQKSESQDWQPTKANSVPFVMNDKVKKWVNLFNGKLKPHFDRWVTRLGIYGPTIEKVLEDENVPKDLIYLAMIESGFNMVAKSHASAVGPWQFISSTGRSYGLQNGIFIEDRRDLIKATQAAAKHLKDLYKVYGDWYLAFSAYNAGGGTVNRAIRKMGTKDYWKLSSAKSRYFRQETKDYVPKFLAAMHIVKNYKQFGYSLKSFGAPLEFETVTVPDATDISAIAKAAGASPESIQTLNPSLVIGITPPNEHAVIYIPKGSKEDFEKNYANMSVSERLSYLNYQVGKKETLNTIAKKFNVSAKTLARENHFSSHTKLKPGMTLKVPADKSALLALASGKAQYRSGSDTQVVYYRVKSGDTLARVAKKNHTSVGKLAQWNKLNKKSHLKIGQKLKIYRSAKPAQDIQYAGLVPNNTGKRMSGIAHIIYQDELQPQTLEVAESTNPRDIEIPQMVAVASSYEATTLEEPAVIKNLGEITEEGTGKTKKVALQQKSSLGQPALTPENFILHRIRSGETLWSLSKKYKVKISDIMKWNKLKNDQVKLNQKIRIIAQSSHKNTTASL